MYEQIRPWLFRMDPEQAAATVSLMQAAGALPPARFVRRAAYHPRQQSAPVHTLDSLSRTLLAWPQGMTRTAWPGAGWPASASATSRSAP